MAMAATYQSISCGQALPYPGVLLYVLLRQMVDLDCERDAMTSKDDVILEFIHNMYMKVMKALQNLLNYHESLYLRSLLSLLTFILQPVKYPRHGYV